MSTLELANPAVKKKTDTYKRPYDYFLHSPSSNETDTAKLEAFYSDVSNKAMSLVYDPSVETDALTLWFAKLIARLALGQEMRLSLEEMKDLST